MIPRCSEVVVIGGGLMGCASAYYLARGGHEVVVLEKDDLASGASGACDGFIISQTKKPGVHLSLALKSIEMYPQLVEELESPYDLDYRQRGGMIVIETPEQLEAVRLFVEEQRRGGINVELLDTFEATELERQLSPEILGATFCPDDAQINPMNLNLSLGYNAKRLGARIFSGVEVTDLKVSGSGNCEVITTQGTISCDFIVNAAGAWAGKIASMVGLDIPIIPRRGQLLVTEELPPFLEHVILSAKYLAAKFTKSGTFGAGVGLTAEQTADGNLLLGSTREFVGYDNSTTYEGMWAISSAAVRLFPKLHRVGVIRTFSGLRPYTPDGVPVLGPVEGTESLLMAAGHEGDGVALAPITGRIINDWISGNALPIDTSPFAPDRFAKRQSLVKSS